MDNNEFYDDRSGQEETIQTEVNPKTILSRIGIALSLMAAAILLSQVILSKLVSSFLPSFADSNWYSWVLVAISMYGVGLPVLYMLTKNIPDSKKKPVQKLKVSQFFIIFFISAAAMYLTNFFSVFINLILSLIKGGELINPAMDAIFEGNPFITFLYTAIGAPIVEEIIFRKILLNKVRRFGDLPAILITGIAFGMFHMNLAQIFYAAALGIIFAYVTIRTNTIRYSILLHIMINTIGATLAPMAVKQGNLVLLMLLGTWEFAAIAAGVVFFIVFVVVKKKITLEPGEIFISPKSSYLLNAGTILFLSICLAIIVRGILLT
ncbi:MAG: CPBP family intramembrane metalloprotease [Lachnospiraceae bacterium]|jgi:membrane protease YdiL (CAAX protease family)|nr:CPBP family intramembrane metalloprotease [Lachnospiraceae bacterium]